MSSTVRTRAGDFAGVFTPTCITTACNYDTVDASLRVMHVNSDLEEAWQHELQNNVACYHAAGMKLTHS